MAVKISILELELRHAVSKLVLLTTFAMILSVATKLKIQMVFYTFLFFKPRCMFLKISLFLDVSLEEYFIFFKFLFIYELEIRKIRQTMLSVIFLSCY